MAKREILLACFVLSLFLTSCNGNVQVSEPEHMGQNNSLTETQQKDNLTVEERHWKRVFNKAFQPVDCPAPRDPNNLPDSYYKGPMIDTHIHLQSLPDGAPGYPDDYYIGDNLGTKRSMDEWACMIKVEGTSKVFGFFPVWDPIRNQSIAAVKKTMEKYPGVFIPFIMPPTNDGTNLATVAGQELDEMLSQNPEIFQGYGEIGLYGHDGLPDLPPDSARFKEIYPVIRKHQLVAYFHLGEGQKEALERAARDNPGIIFIFHGDQLIDCAECDKTPNAVAEILENHPNVYYGIDELYGDTWLLKPGESKEKFVRHFADYEQLLEKDMANWKEFIEAHPGQVLWGTDRGVSNSWDTDPEVALALNNYTRAFIGKLDPSAQEKFAYRNAEKIFQG